MQNQGGHDAVRWAEITIQCGDNNTRNTLTRSIPAATKSSAHLHEKDGVKYHKRFRQGAGDVGVLVEPEHARPRGHGHGLDVFHVTAVRVFGVVVNAGVDAVFVERVVRVEYLEDVTRMVVSSMGVVVIAASVLARDTRSLIALVLRKDCRFVPVEVL